MTKVKKTEYTGSRIEALHKTVLSWAMKFMLRAAEISTPAPDRGQAAPR